MPDTITVSIKAPLRKKIDKHSEGNRSYFIRKAVEKYLEKLEEEKQ